MLNYFFSLSPYLARNTLIGYSCIIRSMFSCFFGLSTYVTENTVYRNNVKRSLTLLVTASTEVRLTQSHKGVM